MTSVVGVKSNRKLLIIAVVAFALIGIILIRIWHKRESHGDFNPAKEIVKASESPSITPSPVLKDGDYKLYVLKKYSEDAYICNGEIYMVGEDNSLYKKNADGGYDLICKYREEEAVTTSPFRQDIYDRALDIILNYGIKNHFSYEAGVAKYVCSDDQYDYFELSIMNGGGSGEKWGGPNSGVYIGIHQVTGEIKEFKDLRAGYCKEKDGWVYYLDLINEDQERAKGISLSYVNGIGYPCRMKPDGSERQVLSHEIAVGGFYLYDDKVYFISFTDHKLMVISEDGKELFFADNDVFLEISEKAYHHECLELEFYGKYILYKDDNEVYICILTDLSDCETFTPPEAYSYMRVVSWDYHSILFSAYKDKDPQDNILYLFSDL